MEEETDIEQLVVHPEFIRIHNKLPDPRPDLLDIIREHGMPDSVLVSDKNVVLEGYDLLAAAKGLGLTKLAVRRSKLTNDLDVAEAAICSFLPRDADNYTKGRLASTLLKVETARASQRQQHAPSRANEKPGRSETLGETLPQASDERGRARDKVGALLGWSGKTAERAAKVADEIDRALAEGETEWGEDLKKAMNDRGVESAFKKMNKRERNEDEQPHLRPADENRERVRLCRTLIGHVDRAQATVREVARHPFAEEICLSLHAGEDGLNLSQLDAMLTSLRKACERVLTQTAAQAATS